jgi:hypothetical protein
LLWVNVPQIAVFDGYILFFGPEKGVIGSRSLPDLISFTPLDKSLFGFAV